MLSGVFSVCGVQTGFILKFFSVENFWTCKGKGLTKKLEKNKIIGFPIADGSTN